MFHSVIQYWEAMGLFRDGRSASWFMKIDGGVQNKGSKGMNNWLYRLYERMLWSQVRTGPSPNHIGLIVDGNRRFAEGRGLSKNLGHEEGSRRLEEFLRWCWRLEIKIVTLYGFSTENFNRSTAEVDYLMDLIMEKLKQFQTYKNLYDQYKEKQTLVIYRNLINDYNQYENLIYDKGRILPCLGGTTTLIYDTKERKLDSQFLSLVGTLRNCSGGPTPWNSWISCEELVMGKTGPCKKNHGWCFEVPVTDFPKLADPTPLKAMGRFNHEAVAVEPDSGDVYLTEDRHDGLIYRFIPSKKGELSKGGKLYALKISGSESADTRNWDDAQFIPGQKERIEWIELNDVESPKDDLRFRGFKKGAACFARGEGMWYSDGSIYFACTNGGIKKRGQIWKLTSSKIELFAEPNDPDLVDNCDNLTVSPSGDLFLCEDGKGQQFIDVITPDGNIFKLAKNSKSTSEFSGPTFSPDGSTLFVNIQHDGLTLAITGPWGKKIG